MTELYFQGKMVEHAKHVDVEIRCVMPSDDALLKDAIALYGNCADAFMKTTELQALLNDGLITMLVANKSTVHHDREIMGFLLFYSHYSTWVGETTVIRNIVAAQQDKLIAMELLRETFNMCQKASGRFDVFTEEEWLKQVLTEMKFVNLSLKEEWDCYSLKI